MKRQRSLAPVVCKHCGQTYDLANVTVTARYMDCSVWTTPCCSYPGVDDRPGIKERHYREISHDEERAIPLGRELDRCYPGPYRAVHLER